MKQNTIFRTDDVGLIFRFDYTVEKTTGADIITVKQWPNMQRLFAKLRENEERKARYMPASKPKKRANSRPIKFGRS